MLEAREWAAVHLPRGLNKFADANAGHAMVFKKAEEVVARVVAQIEASQVIKSNNFTGNLLTDSALVCANSSNLHNFHNIPGALHLK